MTSWNPTIRSDREGQRRALEETIQAKREMNALLPAGRIPPELVSHILRFASQQSRRHHKWLPLTHVFHYWREVSLNDPRLWTRVEITPTGFELARQFLRRSQQSSLDVDAHLVLTDTFDDQKQLDVLNEALQEWHRVKHLAITLPHDYPYAIAWPRASTTCSWSTVGTE